MVPAPSSKAASVRPRLPVTSGWPASVAPAPSAISHRQNAVTSGMPPGEVGEVGEVGVVVAKSAAAVPVAGAGGRKIADHSTSATKASADAHSP